jgi:dTMP kinase
MHTNARGKFIVFEGLDCSGSSTQAALLADRLICAGRKVYLTSEPSTGPVGMLIRLYFSGRMVLPPERETADRQFAYLFAADRFDHLYNPTNGVIKHLDEGTDVITTRYVLSSLAYHVESEEEEGFVWDLNSRFPSPDHLVFLDCSVELSLSRIAASRASRETYEHGPKLERVHDNYQRLLKTYTGSQLVVDAALPKEEIANRVFAFIQSGARPL